MTVQSNTFTPEAALQRIDAIADELQTQRQIVQALLINRSLEPAPVNEPPSVLDIVQASPGHRVFQTAEEVTRYLQEERSVWGS